MVRVRLVVGLLVVSLGGACGDHHSGSPDASGGDDGGGGDDDATGSNGPQTIMLTLTNRPSNPAPYSFLVAYQDGSSDWKLAPAPTGDTYSFTVSAPSYGVMYACIGSQFGASTTRTRAVTEAHFAVAERTSLTLDVPPRCSDKVPNTVTLSGKISNAPGGGLLAVAFGARTTIASSSTGNFIMQVPPGTRDLFVIHAQPSGGTDFYVDSMLAVRDVAVTASTTKAIDFSTAQDTDSYNVTANVTAARISATTTLYTSDGTAPLLTRLGNNWESDALAASLRDSTDVYDQSIAVFNPGTSVTVSHATSDPGDQTFVSPGELGVVTSTVPTSQPYIEVASSWPAYDQSVGYIWTANQNNTCSGTGACNTMWTAMLSPGVVGTSPGYRMPDLSALAGWTSDYAFIANTTITGNVTAIRSSAGTMDFPTTPVPADGTDRVFARADYDVTP